MLNVVFVLASLHLKKRIQSFYCERSTEAGSNRTDDAAEPAGRHLPSDGRGTKWENATQTLVGAISCNGSN